MRAAARRTGRPGCAALVVLLALTPALAAEPAVRLPSAEALPLPEHTARYLVSQRGKEAGYLDLRLSRRDDGAYEYAATTKATAVLLRLLGVSAREHGRFDWHQGHIRPVAYSQVITRPGRHRFWEADFDWRAMRATGESHRGEIDVALSPEVLDPLTLRLQLAVLMANPGGPAPAYEFRVLERDRIEAHSFLLRARESFAFGSGCLPVVRMERLREDDERKYYSWHAAQFYWLPVRIQQAGDGREELDLRLTETSIPLVVEACPR